MLETLGKLFKRNKPTHTILNFDEVMIGWKELNKERGATNYIKLEDYLKQFQFIKKQ